jgi:glycosyl transferase family 25
MNIFDFFEKIYCINLDTRQDRWEKVKEQFSKFGIEGRVERISGFVLDDSESVDSGERSCMISHIKCLKDAKEKNYKNFLILEDDVFFSNKFSEKISLALKELPDDWDMLYLGFCPKDINSKFSKYSDNLFKLESDCFCTHSIAYNQKFLNILFNNFDNFIKERAYDIMLSTFFHKEFNCYAINPPIVHQQLKLNSNVNNLPFQVCWNKNRFYEYKNINKIIKLFLDSLQKSKPSWKEHFMKNIRKLHL